MVAENVVTDRRTEGRTDGMTNQVLYPSLHARRGLKLYCSNRDTGTVIYCVLHIICTHLGSICRLGRGALLAMFDLESVYRIVLVYPADRGGEMGRRCVGRVLTFKLRSCSLEAIHSSS